MQVFLFPEERKWNIDGHTPLTHTMYISSMPPLTYMPSGSDQKTVMTGVNRLLGKKFE